MAYINRELALKLLERNSITKHITFSDGVSIYDTIANIPTADVAPKSEFAMEIFAGVKLRLQNMADKYGYKAALEPDFDLKKEYRGAQIGVSVALHSVVAYEEELKKKYTGDQKGENHG